MALQRVFVRRNRIETLLLKEKVENNQIVECPTDEWLALWEEYAKEDEKERNLWGIEEIGILTNEAIRVLQNLQLLKKKERNLFTKIFEEHFIVNLIWVLSRKKILLYVDEPREFDVMFINFVKKNLKKDALEDVLWERIQNDMLSQRPFDGMIDMVDVVSSVNTWKDCFKKEVHVDLKNLNKMTRRCWPIFEELEHFKNFFMPFLNAVDGFTDSKTFFLYGSNTRHLEEFVEHADEEMMLMALKKNFIDVECIDKTIELAMKAEKIEFLPLLILKKNSKENN